MRDASIHLQSTDKHGREKLQLGLLIQVQGYNNRYRQEIHDRIRRDARDCVPEVERVYIDTSETVSHIYDSQERILPVVFWLE